MATRRERVILDVESNIASVVARDAAAVKLLERNLNDLGGASTKAGRSSDDAVRGITRTGDAARKNERDIDRFSGRLRLLADAAAILGPALIPLGSVAIPAVAGLATQLGFATAGAGTAVLAFKGVGDSLEALNKYQLEPSAENFAALQEAMAGLGPEAREFVHFLDEITPRLQTLREEAQGEMLPGVQEGIDSLLDRLPEIRGVISEIAGASGALVSQAGSELASDDWDEFFAFLESEARPALMSFGRTIGNVFEGVANTWMALDPLSDGFTSGLLDWSRGFADATENLDENQGFIEFVDYVQTNGPRAMDALGSIGNAFIEVIEAAAPIGAVTLPAITALADALAAVANSPAGPVLIGAATGLAAVNRAVGLYSAAKGASLLGFLDTARKAGPPSGRALGMTAAGIGAFALSLTDLDEKAGISNTAMMTLLGTMVAPGWGTAIGAAVGGTMDLAAANDDLEDAIMRANQALDSGLTSSLRQAQNDLRGLLREQEQAPDLGTSLLTLSPMDNIEAVQAKWRDLSGATADARDKLNDVNRALRGSSDIGTALIGPLGMTEDSFYRAAESADQFRESVGRAFAMLDKRAALREARAAIRDFNQEMKDAPGKLREGSAAYDAVEEALDDIARSSLEAAEHMRGMNRVNFLDKQRGAFIDAARQMGMTSRQARNLADDLGLLDKMKVQPKVDGDIKPISRKLNQARGWMDDWGRENASSTLDADNGPARGKISEAEKWGSIFGSRKFTATVDADISGVFSAAAAANNALDNIADEVVNVFTVRKGKADGGTIDGPRYPYGDKVLTPLAPGEEVISNRFGQADRHRQLLKAINAGMADGGTVERRQFSAPRHAMGGSTRVIERVVETLPSHFRVQSDIGEIVLTAVDDRIGDHNAHASRPATNWNGVTRD